MKRTRGNYEKFLNSLGVPKHDKAENGGRCKGENYGSYLRRKDPIAFDVGYREWHGWYTHE
jgi:hypothetical protein